MRLSCPRGTAKSRSRLLAAERERKKKRKKRGKEIKAKREDSGISFMTLLLSSG